MKKNIGIPGLNLSTTFPLKINESSALGLDLGVGSCGQALVYDSEKDKLACEINGFDQGFPNRIAFLGVRAFDIPEIREKTGIKLKNPERRAKRLMRRTTRRRAWRMWAIRSLFKEHKLFPADYPDNPDLWKNRPSETVDPAVTKWSQWHAQMTAGPNGEIGREGPLELRVKGLDEKLTPLELAAALLHLAKHRGFKSNRKSEAVDSEGGKVLTALGEHKARCTEVNARTHGEMLLIHPDFQDRKRNREGVYTGTALRKAQEEEIKLLFQAQRSLENSLASDELETKYLDLFNQQLPLQNPIKLLGECPFEKGQLRCSRLAPSFELSRALQKLNNLWLIVPGIGKIRLADHLEAASGGLDLFITDFATFGTKANPGRITWKDLRKLFRLDEEIKFPDLPTPKRTSKKGKDEQTQSIDELEKEDFLTRSSSNGTAKGSHLLRNVIEAELWDEFITSDPAQLDATAFALTFFEQIENDHSKQEFWGVLNQMRADQLDTRLIAAVGADLQSAKPTLAKFTDTASVSALTSRKLVPLLANGIIYSEACTELYGDHRQTDFDFETITNPVVKSVVRESLKQVIHLIDETGHLPGRICVEIGRDLGKSIDERNEMEKGIRDRTDNRNANRANLAKELGCDPSTEELLRFELWLEQSNTCPYCGESISGDYTAIATCTEFETDHILPRSRSHDNSYENKVLVHRKCNRDKANDTPFEFSQIGNGDKDSDRWLQFTTTVGGIKSIRKQKRRNLLNTTFAEDESKFASRHLNDTRYISKLVTHYLHRLYEIAGETPVTESGGKKRVFVQPGPLTSLMRKSWGLENLKKDRDGRRLGDKHHAIDALICALLSEGQRQFITLVEQRKFKEASRAIEETDFVHEYREMEQKNDHTRTPRGVKPPWKDFRNDVVAALDLFTVSRRENRRGRGSLHKDTLYRVETEEGKHTCYSRRSILAKDRDNKLIFNKISALEKIKDINLDRNKWLKETLTNWINAGSPTEEENLPRDPQGAIIRKVTISQGKKSGREYPQGFVTGGDQVRVDVFSKTSKSGVKNYFLVPIYAYHLTEQNAPNRAIAANKDESDWTEINDDYHFEFTLWPRSRFEVKKKPSAKKPEGEHLVGLYTGVDRTLGQFTLNSPDDSEIKGKISVKTGTLLFRKITTDRLGREYVVTSEKRTWRGKTIS